MRNAAENLQISEFELECKLENVQSLVDALTCIKWKRKQDVICEVSIHGMVFIAEELNCLQAKLYFPRELFKEYTFRANERLRFAMGLNLLHDCLNAFVFPASQVLQIQFPSEQSQLILSCLESSDRFTECKIRTVIPNSLPTNFEIQSNNQRRISFTLKLQNLKEAIEDLDWPGSSIDMAVSPFPPMVSMKADGHGELQIDLKVNQCSDVFIDFVCDRATTNRYKYKFLRLITTNIPFPILKENRGSKLSMDGNGVLKVQHILSFRASATAATGTATAQDSRRGIHTDTEERDGGFQQRPHTSFVEFFVVPQEEE